eukprot:SAG11_NODE_1273_length_5332_cov_9.483088_6_plen_263_part_00
MERAWERGVSAPNSALPRPTCRGPTCRGGACRGGADVEFLAYQLPELLRTPLEELCLQIKSLGPPPRPPSRRRTTAAPCRAQCSGVRRAAGLGRIEAFLSKALEPPQPLAVRNAIELLRTIGALQPAEEELTPLGLHLASLPVDPKIGKLLLLGAVFQCLEPTLTIAAVRRRPPPPAAARRPLTRAVAAGAGVPRPVRAANGEEGGGGRGAAAARERQQLRPRCAAQRVPRLRRRAPKWRRGRRRQLRLAPLPQRQHPAHDG